MLTGQYLRAFEQLNELLLEVIRISAIADHIDSIISRPDGDPCRESAVRAMGLDEAIQILEAAGATVFAKTESAREALDALPRIPKAIDRVRVDGRISAASHADALLKIGDRIVFKMSSPAPGVDSAIWIRRNLSRLVGDMKELASTENYELIGDEIRYELREADAQARPIADGTKPSKRNGRKESIGERMATIYTNDRLSADWTSEEWADKLGCDPSTVRKTKTWKTIEGDRSSLRDIRKRGVK